MGETLACFQEEGEELVVRLGLEKEGVPWAAGALSGQSRPAHCGNKEPAESNHQCCTRKGQDGGRKEFRKEEDVMFNQCPRR